MSDAVQGVGQFIIGSAVAAVGFLTGNPALIQIGVGISLSGVGKVIGAIAGRPSRKQAQRSTYNPAATLKVVYGETRLGLTGADIWVDDDDISDRESLWTFGVFCIGSEDGNGIEDVTKIWIDDVLAVDPVSTGGTTNVTTNVTSWFSGSDLLTYNVRLGTDSQGVNTDAQSAASNASDRYPNSFDFTGLCYTALNLWKDKEKFPSFPQSISAKVRGNRVYDPRDTDGGPNNDGWVWDAADSSASENPGQNPALILLDYLTSDRYGAEMFYPERDGGDTSLSEIDEQSFIDAANYCDEAVQDGDGGTHPRFQFNDWLDTGNSLAENIQAITNAMRASLVMQEGTFRVVIPQTQNSVMTIDEDDIIGDWSFARQGPRKVPNRVVAQIPGGDDGETSDEVQYPDEDDTTFLDQDNGVPQVREMVLHGVDDPVRAEQIAMVTLKEAREDVRIQFTGRERLAELEVGDVFTLDHELPGWQGSSSKDFRVVQIAMKPDFTVTVSAQEYADSAYSLDSQTRPTPPPGSNLPDPTTTGAPSNLLLTSDATTQQVTPAGDKVPGVLATYDLPTDEGIDRAVVVERENGTSEWNTAAVIDPRDDQRALFRPEAGEDGDTWQVGVYVVVGQRQRKSAVTTATVTLSTDFVASDLIGTVIDVDVQEDDFDSDGTVEVRMLVDVIDSGDYDLEFSHRQGPGTSWTGTSTRSAVSEGDATETYDAELQEKKNTFLRLRVFKAGTTDLVGRPIFVTADPDDIAKVEQLSLSLDQSGTLSADAAGDSDTAKNYLTHTTDGSEPSDPTSSNADQTINARSGSVTFSGTVPKAGTGKVKARGENADGQIAPVDTIKSAEIFRDEPISTTNLLGQDAGPEIGSGGTATNGHRYVSDLPGDNPGLLIDLAGLQLEVGDKISLRGKARSATGTDRAGLRIEFRDSSDSFLSGQATNFVTSGTAAEVIVEDVTIPANTEWIKVLQRNPDGTEEIFTREVMLNRGPIAAPYTDPPDRSAENLLTFDAFSEHSDNNSPYTYFTFDSTTSDNLSGMGISGGDLLSFSGRCKIDSDTGSDEVWFDVRFYDSGGSLIGTTSDWETRHITSTSFVRVTLHGIVVPDNAESVIVAGRRSGTGTTKRWERAMLNRGARAAEFQPPSLPPFSDPRNDQRFLPQVNAANLQAVTANTSGNSPLTATDADSSATINVDSHTVQYGFGTVSYNQGTITGLSFETKYHVYADDSAYSGGSVSYEATTDAQTVTGDNARYFIGTITTPADGGGDTDGSGGGGNSCVSAFAFAGLDRTWMRRLWCGDDMDHLLVETGEMDTNPVQAVYTMRLVDCVELSTPCGARLVVSADTPCTLRDGSQVAACKAQGHELPVWDDGLTWEPVTVEPHGEDFVVPMNMGGGIFPAGMDKQGPMIFTHNGEPLK